MNTFLRKNYLLLIILAALVALFLIYSFKKE
jgi:hypothetical protein